jgi:hypothetical protein
MQKDLGRAGAGHYLINYGERIGRMNLKTYIPIS